ncbi:hypothetical protein [Ectopseudomonas composti]|uniref:hypothetical protein n=1 Tax=Ectopseudomonas composti TaxID=658457 RepID=UPI00077415F1|nr:hypothetical protein [Pseudomonas composti]
MDARYNGIRFPLALSISLTVLALAGCTSTAKAPAVHPGLAVFEKAVDLPANPHSIVREGDQVTYVVMRPEMQSLYARFEASCVQGVASMYFPTTQGMLAFAEPSAADSGLPAPQLQQFLNSAQLRDVCTQRPSPDWRALEQTQNSDWLALDRNSLQREGDLLYVWAEQNPLRYRVEQEGVMLRGRSQERLALNCQQNTLMQMSQFYVDSRGELAGGQIKRQIAMQPLVEASDYQQRVFKAACQPVVELSKLPVAASRAPLPPVLDTPVAADTVISAILDLKLPAPERTLRKLSYRYDAQVMNRVNLSGLQQEVFFSVDAASGQVLQQIQDPTVDPASIHLTFLGLFDLAARAIDTKTGKEEVKGASPIGLSFSGDWQSMPSNTEVSYTRTFSRTPSTAGEATRHSNTVTCRIGAERPASSLHPALLGAVKHFNCTRLKTKQVSWTEDYWYLSDYRLFVKASENNLLSRMQWRIESVE